MWLFSDREAEIERLRGVAAELSEQLAGARREIQIVAALKMALAHERKQRAAAKAAASASQELIEASEPTKANEVEQPNEREASVRGEAGDATNHIIRAEETALQQLMLLFVLISGSIGALLLLTLVFFLIRDF